MYVKVFGKKIFPYCSRVIWNRHSLLLCECNIIRWSKPCFRSPNIICVVFSNQITSKFALDSVIYSSKFHASVGKLSQKTIMWWNPRDIFHFFEKDSIPSKSGEIWSANSLWARRTMKFTRLFCKTKVLDIHKSSSFKIDSSR